MATHEEEVEARFREHAVLKAKRVKLSALLRETVNKMLVGNEGDEKLIADLLDGERARLMKMDSDRHLAGRRQRSHERRDQTAVETKAKDAKEPTK